MSTYTDSGRIGGLGNLGMDLDKTGHLTFNPLKLLASGSDEFLRVVLLAGVSPAPPTPAAF